MKLSLRFRSFDVYLVFIFLISTTSFATMQILNASSAESLGVFVVDAISLKRSLLIYDVPKYGFSQIIGIYQEAKSFIALTILYYFSPTPWGFFSDFITNFILVGFTCAGILKLASIECKDRKKISIFIATFILLNPYILALMLFPNKEIPLMFLSVSFALSVMSKKYISVFLLILITYFIRDGHALVFLLSYLIYFGLKKYNINAALVFFVIILFLIAASFIDLSALGGPFERNVSVGNLYKLNQLSAEGSLLYSAIYNSITQAFRMQFLSESSVYTINIGLWLLGICVFCTIPISIMRFSINSKFITINDILLVATFTAILFSSFEQPRYFLAALPNILVLLSKFKIRSVYMICATTILINPLLLSLDLLPPVQVGVDTLQLQEIGFFDESRL